MLHQHAARRRCRFAAVLTAAITTSTPSAPAAVVAQWTFEAPPALATTTSTMGPLIQATTGMGSIFGAHSAISAWSYQPGNGSANAYSVNTWAAGAYWQFSFNATGYQSLTLSFDVVSSASGPRDFKIQTSTDGISFTDSGTTYSVPINGVLPGTTAWNATDYQSAYTVTFSLSSTLNNLSQAAIRLVHTSTIAANGGTISTSGSNRIDNLTIAGAALAAIPEASSLLFGAVAATCGHGRAGPLGRSSELAVQASVFAPHAECLGRRRRAPRGPTRASPAVECVRRSSRDLICKGLST